MPKYNCRYFSNGTEQICMMNASSAEEAADRMRGIPWAPGCGPIGPPERDPGELQWGREIAPALLAAVIGASAIFSFAPQPELRETASVIAAFQD